MFGLQGKPGTYRIHSGYIVVGESGQVTVWSKEDADDLAALGFASFDPQAEQKAAAAIAAKASADAAAKAAQDEFDARVGEAVKAQVATAMAAQQEQVQAAVDAAVAAALASVAKPAKAAKADAPAADPNAPAS